VPRSKRRRRKTGPIEQNLLNERIENSVKQRISQNSQRQTDGVLLVGVDDAYGSTAITETGWV